MWKQEENHQTRCQETEQNRQEDILLTANDKAHDQPRQSDIKVQSVKIKCKSRNEAGRDKKVKRARNHKPGKSMWSGFTNPSECCLPSGKRS